MRGDITIYTLMDSKMRKTADVKPQAAARPNFVIVCEYGDWSGFRTLAECERQFPELEELAAKSNRGNHYYQVVER